MLRSLNHLLAICRPEDFALLEPHLEPAGLRRGECLEEPDVPVGWVWFPESGIAYTVAAGLDGERAEVGMFGREGMSGSSLVNGADRTPLQTLVQVPGTAMRIPAGEFQEALRRSRTLLGLFLLFNQARLVQIACTALSNARHSVEARLARWLLMCHDRVDGDEMPLTHEFLALMLGVRRAGVTTALHMLEGAQTIRATRGLITVRDRAKLQAKARGAYGIPETEYKRLLGRRTGLQPPR